MQIVPLELLVRWKNNEFTLVICDQIAKELLEKLIERGLSQDVIDEQITALAVAAEWAVVPEERIESLLSDPDDNVIVACAIEGRANYIVTYDPHFDSLGGEYRGIKIVKAIPFLEALRENENKNKKKRAIEFQSLVSFRVSRAKYKLEEKVYSVDRPIHPRNRSRHVRSEGGARLCRR